MVGCAPKTGRTHSIASFGESGSCRLGERQRNPAHALVRWVSLALTQPTNLKPCPGGLASFGGPSRLGLEAAGLRLIVGFVRGTRLGRPWLRSGEPPRAGVGFVRGRRPARAWLASFGERRGWADRRCFRL